MGRIVLQKAAKILVTGATGLFGQSLVPQMRAFGHEIVTHGFSNASNADYCVDLSDIIATATMLDEVQPDFVINLVGCTDVDLCEQNPQTAFRLNVRGVEVIARGISRRRDCHMIQISSDQVYDGQGPHREDAVDITNVYALSKYAGELAALPVGATILRTNFFGPSASGARSSFSDWILDKLTSQEAFTAFDDVAFSPLLLSTLGTALNRVVELPTAGVFNLGSRIGCTKADFAFAIAKHFGLDPSRITRGSQTQVSLSARRPTDMRMDSSKFENEFGFELPTTEQEICRLELTDETA